MLALLNQSSPSAIENLVRQGYLPNPGSSASLGPSHGLGSSAALRGLDSQAGTFWDGLRFWTGLHQDFNDNQCQGFACSA